MRAERVPQYGDYVFFNASHNAISPLDGFKQLLANTSVQINFAQGCELWSNDQSGFADAVSAAENSEVAIVMVCAPSYSLRLRALTRCDQVGTWSLDQTLLWTPGTNATTGEHVDLSSLALVGAQLALVQAIQATGVPTVVVLVSGKPVAEPWIAQRTPLSSPLLYDVAWLLSAAQMPTRSCSSFTPASSAVSRSRRLSLASRTRLVRRFVAALPFRPLRAYA
jgi:hypothetical protein